MTWWIGKLRTHVSIAAGQVGSYGFLTEKTGPQVVRSVRLQLLVYGLAIAISAAFARPLFPTFWLVPVALGQPLPRAILLAEHTGCSQDDNALTNTRTTHTVFLIRLMWEMPFRVEHHRYPALPFFALASAHRSLARVWRTSLAGVTWASTSISFGSLKKRSPPSPESAPP